MLRDFIRTEHATRRHLKTPFGLYLDGYLSHRQRQGLSVRSVANNLKWVTAFGEYVAENGIAVDDVGERVVEAFIQHYRTHSRRVGPARRTSEGSAALIDALRGSLSSLLLYLRGVGAVPPLPTTASTQHQEVLVEYLSFLRAHRGFAELTLGQHQRWGA